METLYFAMNIISMINTNSFEEQIITAALITITTMPLFVTAGGMIIKELKEV